MRAFTRAFSVCADISRGASQELTRRNGLVDFHFSLLRTAGGILLLKVTTLGFFHGYVEGE